MRSLIALLCVDHLIGQCFKKAVTVVVEYYQAAPPCAAQALNSSCAVTLFGSDTLVWRALVSAWFRSLWCSPIRKPGSKVRRIMRSPCTSRIGDGARVRRLARWAELTGLGRTSEKWSPSSSPMGFLALFRGRRTYSIREYAPMRYLSGACRLNE